MAGTLAEVCRCVDSQGEYFEGNQIYECFNIHVFWSKIGYFLLHLVHQWAPMNVLTAPPMGHFHALTINLHFTSHTSLLVLLAAQSFLSFSALFTQFTYSMHGISLNLLCTINCTYILSFYWFTGCCPPHIQTILAHNDLLYFHPTHSKLQFFLLHHFWDISPCCATDIPQTLSFCHIWPFRVCHPFIP